VAMNLFGFGVRAFYERHDWERWQLTGAYYAPNAFDHRESMTLASAATSKGAAAGWLRAHLGLTHLPILAMGDSPADISMFPLGIGVAPANSLIEVQRAADWVAPHCDDCAVAAALERFVFGKGHEPKG
jgi:hydroxymethylpyrimidine pyrophosphatase-like HAD family hydrolase